MSNSFYEDTILREEFKLVVSLQEDSEFSKYVTVYYEDRITGDERHISASINGARFPETYIVHYKMPVYVSRGELERNWHGTAKLTLSQPVLTNKHSDHPPDVEFHSNFSPFNNHVLKDSICSGNAWAVAKDNGLWHFIISLGALINQDEFVSAEGRHFDGDAYDHWVSRGRKPVTDIKWPLNLVSQQESTISIVPKVDEKEGKLNIVPKTTTPQSHTINITPKAKNVPKLNITERKK